MVDYGESPDTWRGMPVVDERGRELGRLEGRFSDETTGMGSFLLVGDRMIPVEALDRVAEERVRLGVSEETFRQMPLRSEDAPSWQAMQRAYELLGLPGPASEAQTRDVPPQRRRIGATAQRPAEGYDEAGTSSRSARTGR